MRRPPLIANRGCGVFSENAAVSVKDTKLKIDPDPISVAGVVDSVPPPRNANREIDGGLTTLDSVVLENPKRDPDPTCGAGDTDSSSFPENLKRVVETSDTALVSVKET
jgi:hypothetical protein